MSVMSVDDKLKNYILDLIESDQIVTNGLPSGFFIDVVGLMYNKSDDLFDRVVDFSYLYDFCVDYIYDNVYYNDESLLHRDNVETLGLKNNLNNTTFWAMLYIGFCSEMGIYYDFASLTFDDYTTRYYLCEKGDMEDYFINNPRLFVNNNNTSNNTIQKVKDAKFKLIIGG